MVKAPEVEECTRLTFEYWNDGRHTTWLVKRHRPFESVKKSFSDLKGVPLQSVRFFHNRVPIRDSDTVCSLYLKHDDVIEAYAQMSGELHLKFEFNGDVKSVLVRSMELMAEGMERWAWKAKVKNLQACCCTFKGLHIVASMITPDSLKMEDLDLVEVHLRRQVRVNFVLEGGEERRSLISCETLLHDFNYYKLFDISEGAVSLNFNGKVVAENDTIFTLGIKENDIINVRFEK